MTLRVALWVTRELDRALDIGSNVVPLLVDNATAADVSAHFRRRDELLALNFARLTHELFEPAIGVLVHRFLVQPRLQEVRIRTAEEHWKAGQAARADGDWESAEREFDKAVTLRARPEYFASRAVARNRLDRDSDALNDFEAAIALDPFARELMHGKFQVLQNLDRLQDALNFMRTWPLDARSRALTVGQRIAGRIDDGDDLATAVRSVPELVALYAPATDYELVTSALAALIEHLGGIDGGMGSRLRRELDAWRASQFSKTESSDTTRNPLSKGQRAGL